jgi:hypothetical protein
MQAKVRVKGQPIWTHKRRASACDKVLIRAGKCLMTVRGAVQSSE